MRRLSSLLCFLSLVISYAPLHARTIDTAIVGTVTDSSGAVIPGASVTVLSAATAIEKKAVTAFNGEYSVTYLAPGTYDVTFSANGFSTSQQKGIVLQLNQQARINIALNSDNRELQLALKYIF
jgi:hypothetical protein